MGEKEEEIWKKNDTWENWTLWERGGGGEGVGGGGGVIKDTGTSRKHMKEKMFYNKLTGYENYKRESASPLYDLYLTPHVQQ